MRPEEYFDSKEVEMGMADIFSVQGDVWKVPVVGHAIIVDSNDNTVRTAPIPLETLDFDESIYICLDDGEKIKHVLPALPGEYMVKGAVPKDATMEQILKEDYPIYVAFLCHVVPGIVEPDWKPIYREAWLEGVVPDSE